MADSDWEDIDVSSSGDESDWEDVSPSVGALLGSPTSKLETAGRAAVGGLAGFIPFNVGDEIIAGGTALGDAARHAASSIFGKDVGGAPLGQAYDQRLNEVRNYQKAYHEASPILSNVTDIGSQLFMPIKTKVGEVAGIIPKGVQLAKEAGSLGFKYGFGSGEGTDDRLRKGAESAAISSVFAPLLVGSAHAVGKVAGKVGEAFRPLSAEDEFIQAVGFPKSAFTKAEKFNPSGPLEEPNFVQSVQAAKEAGVFSEVTTPAEALLKNELRITSLNDEAQKITEAATAAQKVEVYPSLDTAKAFVAEHGIEPELAEQLANRQDQIVKIWDGSLASLNKLKKMFQGVGYSTASTSNQKALDRIIAHDLRQSTEKGVAEILGDDAATQLRALNNAQHELIPVSQALEQSRLTGAHKELAGKAAPTGVKALAKSAAKGAVYGAVGKLTGGELPTPTSMVTGAVLKPLTDIPAVREAAAKTLIKSGEKLPGATSTAIAALSASQGAPAFETLSQGFRKPKKESTGPKSQEIQLSSYISPTPNSTPSVFTPQSGEPVDLSLLSDAIKQVESGGRANAVSTKGAIGTHQVTPIAMREVMRSQGVDDSQFTNAELTALAKEEGVSEKFGNAYVRLLLNKYDDPRLALAAYNGGPTYIDNLLKKTGADSFDDIEDKLYKETSNYVPKVEQVFLRLQKKRQQSDLGQFL